MLFVRESTCFFAHEPRGSLKLNPAKSSTMASNQQQRMPIHRSPCAAVAPSQPPNVTAASVPRPDGTVAVISTRGATALAPRPKKDRPVLPGAAAFPRQRTATALTARRRRALRSTVPPLGDRRGAMTRRGAIAPSPRRLPDVQGSPCQLRGATVLHPLLSASTLVPRSRDAAPSTGPPPGDRGGRWCVAGQPRRHPAAPSTTEVGPSAGTRRRASAVSAASARLLARPTILGRGAVDEAVSGGPRGDVGAPRGNGATVPPLP